MRVFACFTKRSKVCSPVQPIWDSARGLLKMKWGNIVNRKCSKFEINKTRPEGSGGNWEEGVESPQDCGSSRKKVFFLIVFIIFYLSLIFASTFCKMINSFLLSSTEIFHMYQTRYLNSSLFTQFFIPAFTEVSSAKSHVITWRTGWTLGHTELAGCMEFSVLGLCMVVDIPQKKPQAYSHM